MTVDFHNFCGTTVALSSAKQTMSLRGSSVRLARAVTILLASLAVTHFLPRAHATARGDASSCQSDGGGVGVCFGSPPLQVIHCDGVVSPDFRIVRPHNEWYYFTYRLYANFGAGDVPISEPITIGKGTNEKPFTLKDDNAAKLAGRYLLAPFKQNAQYYYFTVAVYTSEYAKFERSSPSVPLPDAATIRAVVVGISGYDKSQDPTSGLSDLLHADSDARSFSNLLRQAFPEAHIALLTSDAPQNDDLPTQDHIMRELSVAARDPLMCTNDWFIFYFSGHGILGSDGKHIHHYLSTKDFDPGNLQTAIWVRPFVSALESIQAGNKLIVFDSCFSGRTRSYEAPAENANGKSAKQLQKSTSSSKVVFVFDRSVVKSLDLVNDVDDSAATDFTSYEKTEDNRAAVFAAAQSTTEAEEGIVKAAADGGGVFTPSTDEDANDRVKGHGIYTFFLLKDIESQLPQDSNFKEVLGIDLHGNANADQCKVNFLGAQKKLMGEFFDKITKTTGSQLQQPDLTQTRDDLPPITCSLKKGEAKPHDSAQQ